MAQVAEINTGNVIARMRPGRKIEGISAVLLPFRADGHTDFDALAHNIQRTSAAGITPAVNMDTGYANLIGPAGRAEVLRHTRETLVGKPFVAGAFVEDDLAENASVADVKAAYFGCIDAICESGGTPILFQCAATREWPGASVVALYAEIAKRCPKMLAFELGEMFAPFGRIYDLDTVRGLMEIPTLAGMKHSSLDRTLEWRRIALRDSARPDFKIYTGNDLAIDMVTTGSDYLLGLSAFSPEAFAARDKLWETNDARFFMLNDLLQYLGFFAFRAPVPAYKHSAAQFLALRGRIACDHPHPRAGTRPDSDKAILKDISDRLDAMLAAL